MLLLQRNDGSYSPSTQVPNKTTMHPSCYTSPPLSMLPSRHTRSHLMMTYQFGCPLPRLAGGGYLPLTYRPGFFCGPECDCSAGPRTLAD